VQVVQRDATKAAGGGRPRSVSAPPSFPAAATGPDVRQEAAPHEAPAIDLEDLARRLLDPLSRLLRADLRRGRERAGRPYDGRR
jgi:syndecan 1